MRQQSLPGKFSANLCVYVADPSHIGRQVVPDACAGVLRGGDREKPPRRLHSQHPGVRGEVLQIFQTVQVGTTQITNTVKA